MGNILNNCIDEKNSQNEYESDHILATSQQQKKNQSSLPSLLLSTHPIQVKQHLPLNLSVQYTLHNIDTIIQKSGKNNKYNNVQGNKIYFIKQHNVTYQGELIKNLPSGKGIAHFSNSSYYFGDFFNGDANGYGIYIYPNGSVYVGEFSNSLFNGQGTFVYADQRLRYQGHFQKGLPCGQGKQIYKDGSVYQGNFENGLKSGKGVYQWSNGNRYEGNFLNGLMHGKGVLSDVKNLIYRGTFNQGVKNGNGIFRTQNGTYLGKFQNDYMNGYGSFIWNDGKAYQGNFINSMMNGKGVMYYPTNQIAQGIWQKNHNINLQKIRNNSSASQKIRQLKAKHETYFTQQTQFPKSTPIQPQQYHKQSQSQSYQQQSQQQQSEQQENRRTTYKNENMRSSKSDSVRFFKNQSIFHGIVNNQSNMEKNNQESDGRRTSQP